MQLKSEIMSFIKNRKMNLEEKIKYLEYLQSNGIDLANISDDYVSDEKVKVKNVIKNIIVAYETDNMQISQIMRCEKIGIKFESKDNTKTQIAFLSKAIDEKIDLMEITRQSEKYGDSLVFKYICSLRKKDEQNILSQEEQQICLNKLKIILPKEEKKKLVIREMKKSALKNIFFSDDIKNVLETNDNI